MKKILFLLLLTIASYGQTIPPDATPIENIQITNNVQNDTLTKVGMFTQDGVLDYMPATSLPVSTATTNALELKTTLSAGAFSGFAVTNNGDGTISVGSGIAYLRATNDQYAPLIKYPIAAYNNIPLVDNLNNYIVVSYNGGSPALVLNTTGTGIDTQTTSIAIAAARVGTTVHYVSLVGSNSDPNAKLRNRYLLSEGIRRVSGLAISATGRKIATTAGITFSGLIRLDVAGMNTNASDTYTLAYNNGSTWTRVTGQTDINNTQYNNAGTLTALNNNSFRTDYIYALVNSPSKLYVILGNAQYNSISAARLAPTPSSLPVELQQLGVLVGRAIIEKDAVTMEISSPFTQDFAAGAIESHNDLSGLQGGTAGEYNHLTNAQVGLVNGSEQITNKATDFSTVNNILYPSVQAVKTYADGLVVGLLNDRGSYDASTNLYPSTGGSGTAGAILKGNLWAISVAGTLGGVVVGVGDWIRALTDSPGQTASNWGVVEGNFGYVPENVANKTETLTASSTLYPNNNAVIAGLATKENKVAGTPILGDFVRYNGTNTAFATLNAVSPLSFNSGSTTFSISQASTSTNGYLSSTDWNTFNNKAPSTGGTGYIQNQNSSAQSANMWISGGGIFGGSVGVGGVPTIDAGDTKTEVLGSTYSSLSLKSTTVNSLFRSHEPNGYLYMGTLSNHPIGVLVNGVEKLSIASTGAATFASTVTASNGTLLGGTLTSGYLPKATGANSLGNSLIYDNGTNLGIGTTSPNYSSAGRTVADINGASQSMLALSVGGVGKGFLFYTGTDMLLSNESSGSIKFNTNSSQKAEITTNGNFLINKTTDDGVNKFQVNGNGYFSGNLTSEAPNGFILTNGSTWNINTNATTFNLSETGIATRFTINKTSGIVNIANLAGSGTRVVTADASGNLSATNTLNDISLTGTPTAPTATAGTNTTQIATTAFVTAAVASWTDYTPTVSSILNLTSVNIGASGFKYKQEGNLVTVTGNITSSITAANTATGYNITLPISRTNATSVGAGTGSAIHTDGSGRSTSLGVYSSSTTTAGCFFYPPVTGANTQFIELIYDITK